MVSLDSSFLIDFLAGRPSAVELAMQLDAAEVPRSVTPPAASEVLIGGYYAGGSYFQKVKSLIDNLSVLPFDRPAIEEAGRLGAQLSRLGIQLGSSDFFIAAICLRHGETLVTRDKVFDRVPGLRVEAY